MNPSFSYIPHEQQQRINNNNNNTFNSNSSTSSATYTKSYSPLDFSMQNHSNNNQFNNSHDLFNFNPNNTNNNNNNNNNNQQQQGSRYTYTYEKGRPNPPLHSSTSTSSLPHQASYPPISPFIAQSHQSSLSIQPIMSFPPLYRDQPPQQEQVQQLVQQQQQQQQQHHNPNKPHSPTYSLNQPPPPPQPQPALYTYTQTNLHSNNTTTTNTSRTGTDLNSPRFKKGSVHFSSVYKKDSLIGGCAWWIADETGMTLILILLCFIVLMYYYIYDSFIFYILKYLYYVICYVSYVTVYTSNIYTLYYIVYSRLYYTILILPYTILTYIMVYHTHTGKTISSGAVPVNQDYPNPYRLEFKAMFHALNAANVAGIRIPTIKGTNLFALTFLSTTTTSFTTTSFPTSSEQHTTQQPSEFLPFLSTIYYSIRDLIEPIRRAIKRFVKYNIELLPINKNIFAHRLATQSMDKSIRRKYNITTYIESIKNNKDVIYSNNNVYDSIYDSSAYDNNISGSHDTHTHTPPYNTTGNGTGRSSLAS